MVNFQYGTQQKLVKVLLTSKNYKQRCLLPFFFMVDAYFGSLAHNSCAALSSRVSDGPRGHKIGEGLLTEEALLDAAQDGVLPFLPLRLSS